MSSGQLLAAAAAGAGYYSAQGFIEKGSGDTLNLPAGMANVGGNGYGFALPSKTNWDPTDGSNDDGTVGTLSLGDDIYIYAVRDLSGQAVWLASRNSTVPQGSTASESRKLGGCHYGRVRPLDKRYDTGFAPPGQIVPNSCWDLKHRPTCDPTGMVEVIKNALWADIYLASEGTGSWPQTNPVSAYNATPLSGADGYARYFDLPILLRNAGKRFPHVHEFYVYADGAPQGNDGNNDLAWSATSNTDRTNTGSVAKAVSTSNIVDAAGNLWEPCVDLCDDGNGAWEWDKELVQNGKDSAENRGKINHSRWRFFMAGGRFGDGERAGSRCVSSSSHPEHMGVGTGLRGVCDAL